MHKLTPIETAALIDAALAAGRAAGTAVNPAPMGVTDGNTTWIVEDGVCGFAWVNVKPGNSPIAKALVAANLASRDSYAGGVTHWVHDFNQSMTRKEAYARAFAATLAAAGIFARPGSRMD